MGLLLNLFAIGSADSNNLNKVYKYIDKASNGSSYPSDTHDVSDLATFKVLADSQQSIDHHVSTVSDGLLGVQQLVTQMASLKVGMETAFDEHHKLARLHARLKQDFSHVELKYAEKCQDYEKVEDELGTVRGSLKETNEFLENTKAELEALEQRHHLLSIAKKEADETLSRTSSQLFFSQDEAEGLRIEVNSLKVQIESDALRIAELSANYSEAFEKSVLLANRCESYEASLQSRNEEISNLKQQVDLLTHEKNTSLQYSNQKGLEADQTRTEMSKLFEKYQTDVKLKEADLNLLRFEIDGLRSSLRMLEQINSDLKVENEKMTSQARHLQDANKQFEVTVNRLEGKLSRITGNLDAATAAKAQIDQSRAAMSARLDAVTQTLRGREVDVRRLENDVARQAAQIEEQSAQYHDTVEALNARIFELEKELTSQKNEATFYATQVESNKRALG